LLTSAAAQTVGRATRTLSLSSRRHGRQGRRSPLAHRRALLAAGSCWAGPGCPRPGWPGSSTGSPCVRPPACRRSCAPAV